jgi:hypothetical protein
MPGLDPGIHNLLFADKDVDGRDKPGHDDGWIVPVTIVRKALFSSNCVAIDVII